MNTPDVTPMPNPSEPPQSQTPTRINNRLIAVMVLLAFILGLVSGYKIHSPADDNQSSQADHASNMSVPEIQVSLPNSYEIGVAYNDLGQQLLLTGAIDYDPFVRVYEEAGQPLTDEQKAILSNSSDAHILINQENAYFLLNFFWAVGLVNQNPLLLEGPMSQYEEEIGQFASTGGWTLGAVPATHLYASQPLIVLTDVQQARLETVAHDVYRPCCDNPTAFPDCNHGMAMLGLLELMASQDATVDEMVTAAKYVNAFWFPQQTYELAVYFKTNQNLDFADIDPREWVGFDYASGSGFSQVHQQLVANNLLGQSSTSGGGCSV